jgi:hypothetical protein
VRVKDGFFQRIPRDVIRHGADGAWILRQPRRELGSQGSNVLHDEERKVWVVSIFSIVHYVGNHVRNHQKSLSQRSIHFTLHKLERIWLLQDALEHKSKQELDNSLLSKARVPRNVVADLPKWTSKWEQTNFSDSDLRV